MKPCEADKMSAQQADLIIAEFMGPEGYCIPGYDGCSGAEPVQFSESLDSLVPVWEKLGIGEFTYNYRYTTFHLHTNERTVRDRVGGNCDDPSLVIQQAAAIATAKAIKELGK